MMTLGMAVKYFLDEYDRALKNDRVKKPISYALYHAWEWCNANEKERRT